MTGILIYRKGLSDKVLKNKERERELHSCEKRKSECWRLGIRTKGGSSPGMLSLCISYLSNRNSDTSLPRTDRPALILTPNRKVPLLPLIRARIRTQALVKVAVAVIAHFQEKQTWLE